MRSAGVLPRHSLTALVKKVALSFRSPGSIIKLGTIPLAPLRPVWYLTLRAELTLADYRNACTPQLVMS